MKIRSLVLSGALLAVTMASGLTPTALAATKIFESRQQNVTFPSVPVVFVICGSIATSATVHAREFSLVAWDNGHFEVTMKDSEFIFGSGCARVAQAQSEFIFIAGEGGRPISQEQNLIITCGPASATPGLLLQIILGFTIGEDGLPRNVRFHT